MPWKSVEYQETVLEHQKRALTAALHINTLTKPLSQLSCFKVNFFKPVSESFVSLRYTDTTRSCFVFSFQVPQTQNKQIHPFTPILLFLCAEFFLTHTDLDESPRGHFQEILNVFRELKSINNLAGTFLYVLDSKQ